MQTQVLSGVLELARYGLHVVRLHYPIFTESGVSCSCRNPECAEREGQGKHPVGTQWGKSATNDAEALQDMWGDTPWNCGVLLGPCHGIPHEQAVIDIEDDTPEGREIAETLLRDFPTVSWTSGKSIHRLYRYTPNLPNVAKITIRGLEIRIGGHGKETQSVAPPSKHRNGLEYRWIAGKSLSDIPIAALPEAFVEWVNSEYTQQSSKSGGGLPSSGDYKKFAQAGGKIREPGRNNALLQYANSMWRTACKLHGFNLLEDQSVRDQVWQWVQGGNLVTCEPPLSEAEAFTVFRNSEKFMRRELQMEMLRAQEIQQVPEPAPPVMEVVAGGDAEGVAAVEEPADTRRFGAYLQAAGLYLINDPNVADGEESEHRIDEWAARDWSLEYLQQAERETVRLNARGHVVEMLLQDLLKPATVAIRLFQASGGRLVLDRTFAHFEWKTIWLGHTRKKNGIVRGLSEWLKTHAVLQRSDLDSLETLVADLVARLTGSPQTIAELYEESRDSGPIALPFVELRDRLKVSPQGGLMASHEDRDPISGCYLWKGGIVEVVAFDEISSNYAKAYGRREIGSSDLSKALRALGFEQHQFRKGRVEGRRWIRKVEKS